MSRIPYTVDVNEYICSALDQIRKMHETRDYSSLMATVERIQFHASRMEEALYTNMDKRRTFERMCDDTSLSDAEFRIKMYEILRSINPKWVGPPSAKADNAPNDGLEYYDDTKQ